MIQQKEYQYLKAGMEQELTSICKQFHLEQYLENGYLDQCYSLTMPYEDVPMLINFHSTLCDIENLVEESHIGFGPICAANLSIFAENRLHDLRLFTEEYLEKVIPEEIAHQTVFQEADRENILSYCKKNLSQQSDLVQYFSQERFLDEDISDDLALENTRNAIFQEAEERDF